ncbi:hypothetical protein GCM10010383_18370 [Streptomyces lomondensis]|uniref:Uncharacterized protein n=1 Tax=Streptomyces lomondensis TaxID=68229 RepID=A0ABQ2X0H7_9ACTN|nr:hypothetical protein GCM10010383_18370 [Streptomyces lomondensis]
MPPLAARLPAAQWINGPWLGAGQVFSARPAIEDEAVQAEAGVWGRQPPRGRGTNAECQVNAGHLTPRQT